MDTSKHIQHKQQHKIRQTKLIKEFAPKIYREIQSQINHFISILRERGVGYAKAQLDRHFQFAGMAAVIKDLHHKAAFIESNYTLRYVTRNYREKVKRLRPSDASIGINFEDLTPIIDQYFRVYLLEKSAIPISQTTKRFITNRLISEIDKGVDINTAIKNFQELALTGGMPIAVARAKNIALTESTRALSFGGLIGAYMSGVDVEKTWVTSDDERVRDDRQRRGSHPYSPYSHVKLDLVTQDLMKPFYIGEKIKFPGDPDASIENTANCRCTEFFEEKKIAPRARLQRKLSQFLTDFFLGFSFGLLNESINELFKSENV